MAQAQRGHGIGRQLVASAARTGLQFGKSKMTLAAQDNGSRHLTQWYRGMGFAQLGINNHGLAQLEAPISRVLSGTAQRKTAYNGPRTLQAMDAPEQTDHGSNHCPWSLKNSRYLRIGIRKSRTIGRVRS